MTEDTEFKKRFQQMLNIVSKKDVVNHGDFNFLIKQVKLQQQLYLINKGISMVQPKVSQAYKAADERVIQTYQELRSATSLRKKINLLFKNILE